MPYCTNDDVIAEFKSLDLTSSSSILTEDKVDEFISQAGGEMDARFASKFVVPITATASLEVLKQICVWLVVDRCQKILDLKIPFPSKEGQAPRPARGPRQDALDLIDAIMDNKMQLIGATLVSSNGGISSRNVSHNQRHQFHKNREQW